MFNDLSAPYSTTISINSHKLTYPLYAKPSFNHTVHPTRTIRQILQSLFCSIQARAQKAGARPLIPRFQKFCFKCQKSLKRSRILCRMGYFLLRRTNFYQACFIWEAGNASDSWSSSTLKYLNHALWWHCEDSSCSVLFSISTVSSRARCVCH